MVSVKLIGLPALFLTIYSVTISVSGQGASAGGQDIIGQARREYYSLTRQGFNGFQAKIEPNWKVILGPTATPSNLKFFRSLRFAVTVDATGSATVAYEVGQTPKVEGYTKQIHRNLERLVSTFFSTWALFMVSSPFPEDEVQIDRLNDAYHVFYKVQSADVVLTMTSDSQIKELKIINRVSTRTISPVFRKTAEGLVLGGYHTVFYSADAGSKSTIDTTVEYRDVHGLKLPSKIHVKGTYANEPIEAEVSFSEHELTTP